MQKEKLKKQRIKTFNEQSDLLLSKKFLLLITNLSTLKVEKSNNHEGIISGIDIQKAEGSGSFYKELIHPKRYDDFLDYLNSFSEENSQVFKEITVPIFTDKGKYSVYTFLSRIYQNQKGERSLLSLARQDRSVNPVDEELQIKNLLHGRKDNRYKTILHSMEDGFCTIEIIFDLKGNPVDFLFLETNKGFEKQTNLSGAEGKTILELSPNQEEYWFETYGAVAVTGKPLRFQNFAKRFGKNWFDVSAIPIGENNNSKVGIRFLNITAQKTAEDKLKKANEELEQKVQQRTRELKEKSELLQNVFDSTVEGIVVFKPVYNSNGALDDFEYIRVNKVITKQYGQENLIGKRYSEINPDGKEIGIFDALKDTMLTGKPKDFEIFYDKNNYNNWFRITAKRQKGLLISSLEDITKRKFEAEKLQESIRFKRQLTRTSPDLILIFNLYKEKVRYINRDIAPKRGMRKKDIVGSDLMGILPFIHPLEREKAMDFHEEILYAKDSDILDFEFRLKSLAKNWEWYNARGKVFMRNKNGKVFEYIVILRNIDEQKKTQKALLHAEKLSIKGEVARTLAHELRNPLASIGMAADILEKSATPEKDEKTGKFIEIIKRNTKVLNELVTELLTSSNYSASVLRKKCLGEILEATLNLASDRIYLSGIEIRKNYSGSYFINADEEKLKIALLNLIINASEAMDPEKGILYLQIQEDEVFYILSVQDNGHGLTKEQVGKLFNSFYTQKANGMGIGLSSVKNILEEHEAKIEVESEPSVGTTFHLYFQKYENPEKE